MTENDMISEAWIKKIAEEMQDQYNKERVLICEMAKVADLDGYKLVIWPNDEGMIPHFHIIKGRNPNNPEFDACIKFLEPSYYPHGGHHTDRLSSQEIKKLVNLLNSKDIYALTEQTIWQTLMIEWNRNDNRQKIDLKTEMPDYRHIIYPQ